MYVLTMVWWFTLAPMALVGLAAALGAGLSCQRRDEKIIKGPKHLYMRS